MRRETKENKRMKRRQKDKEKGKAMNGRGGQRRVGRKERINTSCYPYWEGKQSRDSLKRS